MEKQIWQHRRTFNTLSGKARRWCPNKCGKSVIRFQYVNENNVAFICVRCEKVFDKDMKEIEV